MCSSDLLPPGSVSTGTAGVNANVRLVHLVRTVEDVIEVPGLGISGRLDGQNVRVGSRTYVTSGRSTPGGEQDAAEEAAVSLGSRETALDAAARAMLTDGLSPVYVTVDGALAGVAGIGDALRPDAATTVQRLRDRGIHVCIASGDHANVVARIGASLGLPADRKSTRLNSSH